MLRNLILQFEISHSIGFHQTYKLSRVIDIFQIKRSQLVIRNIFKKQFGHYSPYALKSVAIAESVKMASCDVWNCVYTFPYNLFRINYSGMGLHQKARGPLSANTELCLTIMIENDKQNIIGDSHNITYREFHEQCSECR